MMENGGRLWWETRNGRCGRFFFSGLRRKRSAGIFEPARFIGAGTGRPTVVSGRTQFRALPAKVPVEKSRPTSAIKHKTFFIGISFFDRSYDGSVDRKSGAVLFRDDVHVGATMAVVLLNEKIRKTAFLSPEIPGALWASMQTGSSSPIKTMGESQIGVRPLIYAIMSLLSAHHGLRLSPFSYSFDCALPSFDYLNNFFI